MLAIGLLYGAVMIWAFFLWRKGELFVHRPFLKTLVAIHPLGFVAVETGWITTEAGRQPWLVYNLMRTSEGISPVPAGNVIWSLGLFLVIFAAIGSIYAYYVVKMIRQGVDLDTPIPAVQLPAGMRPLRDRERTTKA
jgi:cytochrome d ubiquinol oxidase subunit I